MAQGQSVNITTLPLERLGPIKQQLDEELERLGASLQQLQMALDRYAASKDSLSIVNNANKGRELLVPLTSSMYIPGEIANTDTVMVDIGTTYYVEKSIPDAASFFDRKIAMVKENMDKLKAAIGVKQQHVEAVAMVMQQKIAAIAQQQQQQAEHGGIKGLSLHAE